MVRSENPNELWPSVWKETRAKATDIISGLQAQVIQRPLDLTELSELNRVISHVRGPWRRQWSNPLLRSGVKIIVEHFTRQLALDSVTPRSQYRKVAERIILGGYFEGKDPQDSELRAFTTLMNYRVATRRRPDRKIDFSGLVNPDWKPSVNS